MKMKSEAAHFPGSACVSRVGDGVSPSRTLLDVQPAEGAFAEAEAANSKFQAPNKIQNPNDQKTPCCTDQIWDLVFWAFKIMTVVLNTKVSPFGPRALPNRQTATRHDGIDYGSSF
jgi:murein DD-endopeptidase MepM/ murein hydrolase activator NlpD